MKYLCITIVTLVVVGPDIEAKITLKNTNPNHAKGKSLNMHQQHIWNHFDSAQMAKGKYHPWRSAMIFSKHHHLGAHLLQLEFGRWSSTSHTQFFDRPWPTKKHTEPTALLTRGQQFRPFVWCVWVKFTVSLALKLKLFGELDGQHIPTNLIFYKPHWDVDIFHHNNRFAHEFGLSICS